jgi:hypothetical protein
MVYEYCVIGNGLIGAAAALALARKSSSVCVLGAAYGEQNQYFSSHEDDSRIARYWHSNTYWENLARRNAVLLQELAEATAVPLFRPVPVLYRYCSQQTATPASVLQRNGDRNLAPQFEYKDQWGGIIQPKAYIAALNAEASKRGAVVVQCIVQQITSSASGCTLTTTAGPIQARRVLEARGIHFDPDTAPPGLKVVGKIVLYAESEINETCSPYCFVDSSIRSNEFDDVYGIVHYKSCGSKLISKFGFSERQPVTLESAEEIAEWFQTDYQNYPYISQAAELVRTRFSSPHSRIIDAKPCAFVHTANGRPVISMDEHRCVIAGCNGMAAKCCQALAEEALTRWNA